MNALHHALDGVDRRARSQLRDLERIGRGVGIRIERNGLARGLVNPLQILRRVHAHELLVCRLPRRHHFHAALPPARRNDIHDLCPRRTLGMTGRRLVLGEALGRDESGTL